MRGVLGRILLTAALTLGVTVSPLAAQWPAGTGQGWAKLSLFVHSTDERFNEDGEVVRFFANGKSESRAVFLDALIGVHPFVDLWVQLPWYDLSYDDAAGDRGESGLGDARAFVRWSVGHHLMGGVPLSVRVGAKAPVQDFPIDAEVIPVGEGQWDVEAWLEGGHSFWPFPAYASAWAGYRWRMENEAAARDPGDERLFLFDAGVTTRPIGGKVVVEGLFGGAPVVQGIRVERSKREVVLVQPELLLHPHADVTVELGVRLPVHGRAWPAGEQWVAGVFWKWGG